MTKCLSNRSRAPGSFMRHPDKEFSRQLFNGALHLQAEQPYRYGGAGQAAPADDLVHAGFLARYGVVNELLVFAELQGWQDLRLTTARGSAVGREQVFEFAENVFGALAQFGACFDQVMAPFAP